MARERKEGECHGLEVTICFLYPFDSLHSPTIQTPPMGARCILQGSKDQPISKAQGHWCITSSLSDRLQHPPNLLYHTSIESPFIIQLQISSALPLCMFVSPMGRLMARHRANETASTNGPPHPTPVGHRFFFVSSQREASHFFCLCSHHI